MGLMQLVYVSRAPTAMSESELRELASTSARKNAAHGITGLLLYSHTNFLQLIEGDEPDIDALYRKILADPRHTEVELLLKSPAPQRLFEKWNMGLINLDLPGRLLDRQRLYHVLRRAEIFRKAGTGSPGVEALELLKYFRANA